MYLLFPHLGEDSFFNRKYLYLVDSNYFPPHHIMNNLLFGMFRTSTWFFSLIVYSSLIQLVLHQNYSHIYPFFLTNSLIFKALIFIVLTILVVNTFGDCTPTHGSLATLLIHDVIKLYLRSDPSDSSIFSCVNHNKITLSSFSRSAI